MTGLRFEREPEIQKEQEWGHLVLVHRRCRKHMEAELGENFELSPPLHTSETWDRALRTMHLHQRAQVDHREAQATP